MLKEDLLLAADVGGTKTLLGLFRRAPRPTPIVIRSYATNTFQSFTAILDAFSNDTGERLDVASATAGAAGPVVAGRARLTNIAWDMSIDEISSRCATDRVALVNDLEAMGASVELLRDEELVVLQRGTRRTNGHAVVLAAGTGLGQACLHRVNGRLVPIASEGGHADFGPRTDRELALVRFLRERYGRAEVEQVLSGPGLLNLFSFTHGGPPCAVVGDSPEPAAISQSALTQRCPQCVEALDMFVDAYGSEAGNLALRGVATAGVFLGGGIAPKILPALTAGAFLRAFTQKPPMTELLSRMPVSVIVNDEAGLLGAAAIAAAL